MQQSGGQTWNGGHIFQMETGHHWSPAGGGPAVRSRKNSHQGKYNNVKLSHWKRKVETKRIWLCQKADGRLTILSDEAVIYMENLVIIGQFTSS